MPKEFTLTIKLGNTAMQTSKDIVEALEKLGCRSLLVRQSGVIFDRNGNAVGSYGIVET